MNTISAAAGAMPAADNSRAARARRGRARLRRAQQLRSGVLLAAVLVLFLGMIVGVIQSQAQVTRLSSQIEKTQKALTDAQSTYDYLSSKMSDITSSTNVEQIAESQLGLVRADESQITYVKLEGESVVECSSSGADRLAEELYTIALSLFGGQTP